MTDRRDRTLHRLAGYVRALRYEDLPPEVAHKAKALLLDTLGAILAGHGSAAARLARGLAGEARRPFAASVIGCARLAAPDRAAFANAIAARGVDTLDAYHRHGKVGHPADCIPPLLTTADYAQASGKALIEATVIAYEIFCWLRDYFEHPGFDNTNCARIGAAAGAAKLLGLDEKRIAACLSLAAVNENVLKEVRSRPAAMTRETAAGYQARAAVFAALLAAEGGRGSDRAFDGPAGWLRLVADGDYDTGTLGGAGRPFRMLDTWIKLRAIPGAAYPIVMATEKLAPIAEADQVDRIVLEVYGKLKKSFGTGAQRWSPDSRDTADHSAPFIVSTILANGALDLHAFDEDRIHDERVRSLMQKVEVEECADFTAAYADRHEHRARLTVFRTDGTCEVAETGGDADDLSAPKPDAQINKKFLMLAGPILPDGQARDAVERWWNLECVDDIAALLSGLLLQG
ncbi:MmgE/PrpD family protein [Chelativorans alearense]|uniref:MmgE/PrpD family protein n=1 Tax=Chelativorans alearense TaxID=2681495 RepID=UPI001969D4ED|nr:MmgE/PrpD family protein [Chelativorans alearense]